MNAGTGKRFFALDAFRGIMACTVVLLHTIVDTPWLASSLVRNSHIAVDFFFILSGFVICINYSTKLESVVDLKKYAVKRFFRLWPLHLVIMCLFLIIRTFDYVAFRLGFGEDSIVFSDLILFVKELFFLHVLEQGVPMQWNFPAWSISAEIIAYLVFAFLAFGLRSRFVFGMVAVFILSFFFGFILKNYGSMIDTKALRAVTGFCLGAIVAELFFHRRIVQYRIPSILEFIALILLFLNFKFYGILGSMAYPIMLASFTATLTIFAYEGGLISRMLKAWPFQKTWLVFVWDLHGSCHCDGSGRQAGFCNRES